MWRSDGSAEEVLAVGAGVCLDIPTGVRFQFRNTGEEPLTFLIATMPPWPGAEEAYAVAGKWAGRRGLTGFLVPSSEALSLRGHF